MSHDLQHDREERQLAELLRAVDSQSPAADADKLQELRRRAAEAFEAGLPSPPADDDPGERVAPTSLETTRRHPMVSVFLRACSAVVAASVLWGVWFLSGGPQDLRAAPTFGEVMSQLRSAQTLYLQLVKGDSTSKIWVRAPGLVRRELGPELYEIAAGSRLWRIDERNNEVTESNSPWFHDPRQPVDLLALLEVGIKDASDLFAATPVARVERDGRECLAYRVSLPGASSAVQIEALADARTLQLVEIVAWPQQQPRGVPLAELQLVAVNVAVDDEKFTVARSLSEDGRIGKIASAQGVVVVRPLLGRRWTPVCRELAVKPGDWVRAERRGANAVKIMLSSEVELTLGPGSLLECISPAQARLHTGEVQVSFRPADQAQPAAPGAEGPARFELLAPRDGSRQFPRGVTQLVRVDRSEQLVDAAQQPLWLQGFEGTSSNESLGSLIVNLPDGRNEPLTVGYHKVQVEIRDQIARTTIEESFVNHTTDRLEGVFHFPLPQDASISGFGMWVGSDLVEADIVEKQRAREIYETILREKRDPGLLEWTSGNLFKARVFPIEPNSEKRIKIVYTQVLPMRANRYRYGYNLRSELLRTNPLRELSLTVTIHSALPLKDVTCPTHPARAIRTGNSAQLEFAAQEYSPTRDFEVVCEVDQRQSDVVVVPHRRGDDGYFLLQLTPPAAEGNWQRELLPDGRPLHLILLCDTSASMNGDKRAQQAEFVATVLSSLSPNDRFQLACADVGTHWVAQEAQEPTDDNIAAARLFLAERLSLGWTDLDRAFDEALKQAPPGAQIIYIGDGIVSARDSDPASFVKRLERRFAGRARANEDPVSFHAITVGNTHEAVVLKGIAGVGGGSARSIGGEATPQSVAFELLNELAQPGLRDIQVEFRGVKIAAVYPERLPNLPAGTQQILVGRYLPEGVDQQGEVVITARRGKEPVRYAARFRLPDDEAGNSFIPRLWARGHLDHLLAQGQSEVVRDEIIGLSEEYHIMTPYTSLLVLESDADRERFGVQTRFAMRDGERFFADGRHAARLELLQLQMKRARDWRLGLRRQYLADLLRLTRPPLPSERPARSSGVFERERMLGLGEINHFYSVSDTWGMPASGPLGGVAGAGAEGLGFEEFSSLGALSLGTEVGVKLYQAVDDVVIRGGDLDALDGFYKHAGLSDDMLVSGGISEPASLAAGEELSAERLSRFDTSGFMAAGRLVGRPDGRSYLQWFDTLFPGLPGRPLDAPRPVRKPDGWTPEALAAAEQLVRTASLATLEGGLEIQRHSASFDPRWDRRTSSHGELVLWSNDAWLTRPVTTTGHTVVQYCDAQVRGVFSLAFQLGRQRASSPLELTPTPLGLTDFSLAPLYGQYASTNARLEAAGADRQELIISWKELPRVERLLIDTQRHVVLKHVVFVEDKPSHQVLFEDFVEIAGSWWARRVTTLDAEERKTAETTLTLLLHSPEQFRQRRSAELAATATVQFAREPLVRLSVARQKVADGSADFDDQLALIRHNALIQQWEELWKHVEAAEQFAADKPGVRWMRTMLQIAIRRNEEARQRLLSEAEQLVREPRQDDAHLADFVLSSAYSLTSWPEFLQLVERLRPVFQRQTEQPEMMDRWHERLIQCYDALDRRAESLELRRTLADAAPWRIDWQIDYARRLLDAGQTEAAYAHLQKELERPIARTPSEDESLRTAVAEMYRQQTRWGDLLSYTAQWIARDPEYYSAYAHHLSALLFQDQLAEAERLTEQWLVESRIEGRLAAAQLAKLEAAFRFATGNVHYVSVYRMDPRWCDPIADTIRHFLPHEYHSDFATRGMGVHAFTQSDAGDELRGEFLHALHTRLHELSHATRNNMIGFALWGRLTLVEPMNGRKQVAASEVPNDVWGAIAAELRPRWQAAETAEDRHELGESLRAIYAARFAGGELIPFLRERLAEAPEGYAAQYRHELFQASLVADWSDEIEQNVFRVVRGIPGEDPRETLPRQVSELRRAVDVMITNRTSLAERRLYDQGERHRLTRQELAAKLAEIRRESERGVRDRLAAEAEADGLLAPWLRVEQRRLDALLDENLDEVALDAWRILGDKPAWPEFEPDADLSSVERTMMVYDALLKTQALDLVMNRAIRHDAPQAAVDRLLPFFDAGIAQGGDRSAAWRSTKFRLLVVLDRADELERELRAWIRSTVSTAPWRQMLARLRAERGYLEEAIQLFEACVKDRLLSHADYRALADWYLVVNRREDYERARVEAYKQTPERNLANTLRQAYNQWRRKDQPLPPELDEEVLLATRALLEKSGRPEGYFSQLRGLYAACRDFRLLHILPDSVLGRSPQQVYAFMQELDSSVLSELKDEAAADELLARIAELRQGERTTVDLRALDLFEALIERKSSEVLNQPGPHVAASLAALRRAFDREWTEGEPRMMANFLRQLGAIRRSGLAAEQLRELRELMNGAPKASSERLAIAGSLCELLFWAYGRHDEALREMESEMRPFLQAHDGAWPFDQRAQLAGFVAMLRSVGRFAAGEDILRQWVSRTEHEAYQHWRSDLLVDLYNSALAARGEVSLGKEPELFQRILELEERELAEARNDGRRYRIVVQMVDTLKLGRQRQLAETESAVRKLAFEIMPAVLREQQSAYRDTVRAPIEVISQVLGPRGALQYVVERMEQHPQRLELSWENAWQTLAQELARWRYDTEAAGIDPGDLEERTLKLTIAALKHQLRVGEVSNRQLFHDDQSYFWAAKADDFQRAAEEVLEERRTSGRLVQLVADYLWSGLDRHPRAIEIMLVAHRDGVLDERGQVSLVERLQQEKRYGESIAVLELLVAHRPDVMSNRVMLFLAYHHTQRPEQLDALIAQTHDHFHGGGRWNVSNIAEFAKAMFECERADRAVGYLEEAIALHQRAGNSGQNDAVLSNLYMQLARTQSARGNTRGAVDAASAAIVCWDMRHKNRQKTLDTLQDVITDSNDLDAYVEWLEGEVSSTGQDSPLLRRALGRVYQARKEFAKAATQYRLALDMQPDDAELHQGLMACYDALGDAKSATLQLLRLIDVRPHDLPLYQQLAERFREDEAEAERAATSLIEAAPEEAENHQAMAEWRQNQGRWSEAIPHWQRVAELRRLEPTGLLNLAQAQLHEKQWEAAQQTLTRLRQTSWPERFEDVQQRVRQLQDQLPRL